MNYLNVDLKSAHERNSNILDPYSFDILLLEVSCNLREINEETIRKQFEESLNSKVDSAYEIFDANIKSIVKDAQKYRSAK